MSVVTFVALINQLLPEPHAGLLSGLLFGTKATLSKNLYDALVKTGTLHIVALSGMNITILASLVNLFFLRLISRRLASLLTIGIIILFVWFVGASPSVVRAAIMGSIALLAVIFGRQQWSLFSWILAVGIMLLLNPVWIGDLSFQLSALATLGIILFGGQETAAGRRTILSTVMRGTLQRVLPLGSPTATHKGTPDGGAPRLASPAEAMSLTDAQQIRAPAKAAIGLLKSLIADDLHLTLAAQVFTIPLILWYFHRVSLISPLANILIGWLIAPLTILGWFVAVGGWVWLPLGQLVAWFCWVPLQLLLSIVQTLALVPWASMGW